MTRPPIPCATLHHLVTNGGCGQFALPVEARMLEADIPGTSTELRAHAETVADIPLTGITVRASGAEPPQ